MFEEILKSQKKLTPVDKYIIENISNDHDFFIRTSVSEYADSINVSPSALSRLAKKLDFDSFKNMKMFVLQKTFEDKNNKKILRQSKSANLKNIFNIYYESVDKVKLIREELFNEICEDIISSDLIITSGMGTSRIPAWHFADVLFEMDHQAIFDNDFHTTLKLLSRKGKKTLIIFSKDGSSPEINFLKKKCKEFKVNLWVIVGNKYSVKNSYAKVISFEGLIHDQHMFSISSKITMQLIVDFILIKLWMKKEENEINESKILKEWKER